MSKKKKQTSLSELSLFGLLYFPPWVAGVVIANGFWSAAIATCNPIWAWYLVIEKIMKVNGWV